ncbi:MAG: hypothetical protein ABSG63_03895 [Spirochaetia bacterium]
MKKMLVLAALAFSLAACVTVMQPQGSEVLGERTVDFRVDHDQISVGNYEGFFRFLNFQVEKNDVEIFNIVVVYGNGEREKIDTRLVFREGSRSQVVDLDGGRRRIKSIEFTYRTVGERHEGKARVVVFGLR